MNKAAFLALINGEITGNGIQAITGPQLNAILQAIVNNFVGGDADDTAGNPFIYLNNPGQLPLGILPPFLLCTQNVNIESCNLSSLPSLSGLTNLFYLALAHNNLNSFPPLTGLTNLTLLDVDNNLLTSFPSLSGLINLNYLDLHTNSLNQANVDGVLVDLANLVNSGGGQLNGYCDVSGNTAPSSLGNGAIVSLVLKGWTIIHD